MSQKYCNLPHVKDDLDFSSVFGLVWTCFCSQNYFCRPAFLPEEQLHMDAEEVETTVELQESLAMKISQSRNF